MTAVKPVVVEQHKDIKILFRLPFWTPSVALYSQYNILGILSIRDYQNEIFLFKILNDDTLHDIYKYSRENVNAFTQLAWKKSHTTLTSIKVKPKPWSWSVLIN